MFLHDHPRPSRTSGLILWLDAGQGITIDTGVGTWADQSGEGNDVTQATGSAQPTYVADSTLIPDRPAVSFSAAASQFLANDAFAANLTGSDTPCSFFVVACSTSLASTRCLMNSGRSSTGTGFFALQETTAPAIQINRQDDAATAKSTNASAPLVNVPFLVSMVFRGTTADCVTFGAIGNLAADLNVGTITQDVFAIGCLKRNTNSQFWNGEIYEVLVYNQAVTTRERKQIERYLGRKYRLAAAPYK